MPQLLKGGFESFETPLPESAEQWEADKTALRHTLRSLLGDCPPLFTPDPKIETREQKDGYTLERFTFDNGIADTVYGYTLIPAGHQGQGPAILYHHYHGEKYENGKRELITEAHDELDFATGEELVRSGYIVLAIDAYAFGERRWQGPAGVDEEGQNTEEALFKTFLWEGRTLWGMMVRDDLLALRYLLSRPEVDTQRVATMGMSMGSTRSWWVAAMDERIKVVISVACLTRYQNLIARGGLRYHGVYYFVPGMLEQKIDTESVIGLIAPRAHLTLTGDHDNGSPIDGIRTINAFQQSLYKLYGQEDNFRGVVYEGVEHEYTPEMWQETMNWLQARLGAA